jgi:hemerythrin-like domain-containing protein
MMSDAPGKTSPPLVRHESLRPLSRDHYQGLVQAQRLMSVGAAVTHHPYALLEDFLAKWKGEISIHFDDEERLLPSLITCDADKQRLFDEHEALRTMTARLADDLERGAYDPDLVKRTGRLLHDHIRWEERVLFEGIQASSSPEQLQALTEATARIEQSRDRRSCRDRGVVQ